MIDYDAPKIIKAKNFEIQLLDGNIVYFICTDNVYIEVEDIKEGIEIQRELNIGPNVKRILEFQKFTTVTKEAREYIEENGSPAQKEAFIIPSLGQKILFNLYVKFRKRKHPVRAFNDLQTALNWIRE